MSRRYSATFKRRPFIANRPTIIFRLHRHPFLRNFNFKFCNFSGHSESKPKKKSAFVWDDLNDPPKEKSAMFSPSHRSQEAKSKARVATAPPTQQQQRRRRKSLLDLLWKKKKIYSLSRCVLKVLSFTFELWYICIKIFVCFIILSFTNRMCFSVLFCAYCHV
jgi:hypothetical protein